MKAITAMSLFSGCEGASMALSELNVPVKKMYTSEIDKFACKAAALLFPNTIPLGDMTKWDTWEDEKGVNFAEIDILFAGFPCQAWSMAGKQKGDDDPRGALVHDLLDIWGYIKALNPNVKFLFENVAMKKEFMDYINNLFGQDSIMINASLLTAQNRKRNYWVNWEVSQPEDKGILLKDIIEGGAIDATIMTDTFADRQKGRNCLVDKPKDKSASLCAMEYVKSGRQGDYIQCDNGGNQTVFRPCELREGKKPLTFIEWIEEYHPDEVCMTIDTNDYTELADKYMLGSREKIGGSFEVNYEYDSYLHDFLYGKGAPLCHHVATATDINANESNKRIYADSGKSPTLTTMGGGHREPKVLVSFVNDNERVGAITENERGYRPHQNDASKSGVSELGRIMKPGAKTDTVTTTHAPKLAVNDDITNLKYRKLTPRECMRLQGFPAWCIDKLHETGIINGKEKPVISNSQLYKMTGNGFAIPVISHIVKCLLDSGWMSE